MRARPTRWPPIVTLALVACGGSSAGRDGGGGGPIDAPDGPLAEVHLIGRFDRTDPAAPRFAWPGTTIRTRFDGTGLTVRLDDAGDNQFEVTVDGVARPVLIPGAGPGDHVIASGLPPGPHEVVIARRTESFFGPTRFLGFTGAPLIATPAPTRLIELVGDSISCGYGVLGPSATCGFSAATESEPAAWGALAAAELGVAHATIAYSGKGVVRNNGGDTTGLMPALYARTLAEEPGAWSGADYRPGVVVVNLGTNDFAQGDPGPGFVTAYAAFVTDLRARHPQAWIVIALSPMLSDGYPAGAMQRTKARGYLQQVVTGAADAKVVYLELAEQTEPLGCDYHPGRTTQAAMGRALAAKIRELTGW